MAGKAKRKPRIGITPDNEMQEGNVQTLNAAFGGRLVVNLADANPAWAAHRSPPYDSVGHQVNVMFGTRLHALTGCDRFPVNSLHRQGIVDVGPGVLACAIADDGVVEAIEHPNHRFCLGVQWHPEFNISDADGKIFRGFVEECERMIDV
jgi:putative glutamine amidotransferase